MRLKSALLKFKDALLNEEASQQARAAHAMRLKVLTLLREKGAYPGSYEHTIVKNNYLCHRFPTGYLVNSLYTHLPEYQAIEIIEAYIHLEPVVSPSDTLITAEQMAVSSRLVPLGRTITEGNVTPNEKYEALYQYAMTHTEDWHLIEPLVFDRGIHTLPELLGLLSVVKETGSTVLNEGIL